MPDGRTQVNMNYYSQFKVQLVVGSLETTLEIVTNIVTSTGNPIHSIIEQKPQSILHLVISWVYVFKSEWHSQGPPPKLLDRKLLDRRHVFL